MEYAVQGFVDGLREQLDYVWSFHWALVWKDHVMSKLPGDDSRPGVRQRALAFALAEQKRAFPVEELSHLTPSVASHYGQITKATLRRDLKRLEELGLIRKEGERWRADLRPILRFRPQSTT